MSNCYLKVLALPLMLIFWSGAVSSPAKDFGQLKDAQVALAAKRYADAEKILTHLAAGGDAKAMWMLGELYMKGRGVQRDYSKAKEWWEKSAAGGDPNGMCYLAQLLGTGIVGPTDSKRAMKLLERAGLQGCAQAQYCMGLSCMEGFVTKQDYSRA